jgi:signal transduction histidine kinase
LLINFFNKRANLTVNVHENKLKIFGKLAASLTHEIKNPLSVLKLNLDYLKMSKDNFDQEIIECIDASLEAAEIINQLIHNTLEFSRKNRESFEETALNLIICLLYTSPSPRDRQKSRMPSSA